MLLDICNASCGLRACFVFCQVKLGVCEACENKRREPTKTKQEQTVAATLPQCIFTKRQGDPTKDVAKHLCSEVGPASSEVACS